MKPQRLPNGNLLIPVAVETDDVIGDVLIEVTPDDPQYEEWLPFLDTDWEIQAPNSESAEQHAHRL
jgi:hypothetical protein